MKNIKAFGYWDSDGHSIMSVKEAFNTKNINLVVVHNSTGKKAYGKRSGKWVCIEINGKLRR